MFKHFSFDLWLTLIKSNPHFKNERSHFIHENYCSKSRSVADVSSSFRKVDLVCNAINEKIGGSISSDEMYAMVFCEIFQSTDCLVDVDFKALQIEMEKLFFQFPPLFLNAQTLDVISSLSQRDYLTMSISSNTGFIEGRVLREYLRNIEIDTFFNFQIFSDEVNLSKPNSCFFEVVLQKVREIRNELNLISQHVLHIGDNPIADVWGAQGMGLSTFLVLENGSNFSNLTQI
jgi:putative hydrolase of the HAD superfamily